MNAIKATSMSIGNKAIGIVTRLDRRPGYRRVRSSKTELAMNAMIEPMIMIHPVWIMLKNLMPVNNQSVPRERARVMRSPDHVQTRSLTRLLTLLAGTVTGVRVREYIYEKCSNAGVWFVAECIAPTTFVS